MNSPLTPFTVSTPNSAAARVAASMRRKMFDLFMQRCAPAPHDTILDVGVTADQTFQAVNYLETWCPHKERITAAGLDDASFLEQLYPGVKFVHANALALPFPDRSFDIVHSSAVLEHVGSFENQARMIAECARVARRCICLTTPNRWFPLEIHTQLPLVHWLPRKASRAVMRMLGHEFMSREENLNLMSDGDLSKAAEKLPGWTFDVATVRLLGLSSNLLLFGARNA